MGYLEGAAQLKKTKRYRCSVTQGRGRGSLSFSSRSHTQIHTGGRGDASVGSKVLPLRKLKPLITNWDTSEKGEAGRRWIEDRKAERGGFRDGDLGRKIGEREVN